MALKKARYSLLSVYNFSASIISNSENNDKKVYIACFRQ